MPTSDILPLAASQHMANLFNNPLFPDCTIVSNHRIWHLHRAILAPRCEFFYNCFLGSFSESSSARVEMHDDDPVVLERMLRWLYTLENTSVPKCHGKGERIGWMDDLELYMLADKYSLSALMDATRDAMLKSAETVARFPSVFAPAKYNSTHQADKDHHRMEDQTSNSPLVEDFIDTMYLLFASFPERDDLADLRQQLLQTMASVVAKYMRQIVDLEELMTSLPGFAVALVEALSTQTQREHKRASSSLNSLDELVLGRRGSESASGRSASASSGSGSFVGGSPRQKAYVPMNEDSGDEFE